MHRVKLALRSFTRVASCTAGLALASTTNGEARQAARQPALELTLKGSELDFVPIANMVVDTHGRIFVWQDADNQIRRFEATGRELAPVAPAGEGPGEFRLRSIGGTLGDTLWVSDPLQRRTTFIGLNGNLIRTQRWASEITHGDEQFAAGLGAQPLVVEAGGTQLIQFSRGNRNQLPSWWRPQDAEIVVLRVSPSGTYIGLLGAMPKRPTPCTVEFQVPNETSGTVPLPFCHRTFREVAAGQNRVFYLEPALGESDGRYMLRATSLSGAPIYSLELSEQLRRIPKAVVDSARNGWFRHPGQSPARVRAISQAHANMRISDHYPPMTRLFIGGDGTAWVGLQVTGGGRRWRAVSPNGIDRGTMTFPATFEMFAADSQLVWGTILDDDDLPSVVRYRVQ